MRIGIIGGLERAERHYDRLATDAGHRVLFHDGRLDGTGRRSLMTMIERAEVVVFVTEVNSHGALHIARRYVREKGRTLHLVKKLGLAHFTDLLARGGHPAPP